MQRGAPITDPLAMALGVRRPATVCVAGMKSGAAGVVVYIVRTPTHLRKKNVRSKTYEKFQKKKVSRRLARGGPEFKFKGNG